MCTEIWVYLPGSVGVYRDLGLFTWKCGCVLRSGFLTFTSLNTLDSS